MRRLALVRARPAALAALAALTLLAACGGEERLPQACITARAADVLKVLEQAPERATLADGTPLSACIDRAEDDAQLQTLGITFVAVADHLAARVERSPRAAFQLGFLMGAAERGAGPTGGTQAELVQRLEQTVSFQLGSAARERELLRGIAAGRSDG
ncbi:hypothetical protein [Conexibacter woesei]|uniref:hypothetical protein n=1 Tax=Conexibacter woesei TaxID=191495 RepID=UPI0002FDE4E4|nr:hypothetical protein [Conexibacter woesei]